MASVMDGVDQRTQLVGRNRLELLLFTLGGNQRFGINVFKVREVIRCPQLTRIPRSHPVVRGVASMRGMTITVLDLSLAIGGRPLPESDECFVVITEFNRRVQGFLVGGVDRIVNRNWESILPPPRGSGRDSYMTAVTDVDGELVEMVDVEKVLAEVTFAEDGVSDDVIEESSGVKRTLSVMVVDDSSVARRQVMRALEQIGVEFDVACNGREAFERLREMAEESDVPVGERLALVISDVEMPEMDGYTLTRRIREDPALKDLHILLHTSLSGVFNQSMVQNVGADDFLSKFNAEALATVVLKRIQALENAVAAA